MTDRFRLTMAQLNATVGDLDGNCAKARAAHAAARDAGADMLALPEMFLTGYQTQDLVLKPAFLRDCRARVEALAADAVYGRFGVRPLAPPEPAPADAFAPAPDTAGAPR